VGKGGSGMIGGGDGSETTEALLRRLDVIELVRSCDCGKSGSGLLALI